MQKQIQNKIEIEAVNSMNQKSWNQLQAEMWREIFKPTFLNGKTFYWSDLSNCWKQNENNNLLFEMGRKINGLSQNKLKEIQFFMIANSQNFEIQKIENPTLFLNNQKIQIKNKEEEIEDLDDDFNWWNLNLQPAFEEIESAEYILEKFLKAIFPDEEMKRWALANYFVSFVPYNFEKVIFQIGPGKDGKSTITNLLQNILKNKSDSFSLNEKNQFSMANFDLKTAMFETDFDGSKPLNLAIIKNKSTFDWIKIEEKGKNQRKILNFTTLFINSNVMPSWNDSSNGTERRVDFIIFENSMMKKNSKVEWLTFAETNFWVENQTFQFLFLQKCKEAFKELYDEKMGEIISPEKIKNLKNESSKDNNIFYDFIISYEFDKKILKEEILIDNFFKADFTNFCHEISPKIQYSTRRMLKGIEETLKNKFEIITKIEKQNVRKYYGYDFKIKKI